MVNHPLWCITIGSNHNTLNYKLPNFSVFVLGVSYDDCGSVSSSDNTEAGFSYLITTGGLVIEIGTAVRTAGKSNDGNYTGADASWSSFSATL